MRIGVVCPNPGCLVLARDVKVQYFLYAPAACETMINGPVIVTSTRRKVCSRLQVPDEFHSCTMMKGGVHGACALVLLTWSMQDEGHDGLSAWVKRSAWLYAV